MNGWPCETCKLRKRAKDRPRSFWGRFWHWHTKWCPGWKGYQRALARREGEAGKPEASPPESSEKK